MAIGAITMILANVGLQIYNNWCGSRQNAALQQKREEFERAAKDRNKEHMWRLLREGQEMALLLENEKHADRLKELKDEVDHLLEKLTYETTISNWPLKVLPIVMKNQAFGNLLANQEENVAMHVIFTRSNYDKFNKLVYPVVEKQLEQYCDKHWSTMTDHPILFYSGAWKPMVNPTDVQVTAMREELKNLPTLLITPFFRPNDGKLVFQLHMWGVGADSTDNFEVPEIEQTDFQRPFNNQDDYDNEEGLLEEIVEDIVPYLECMIGYMADTYFWSSAGLAPHLPLLLTNGTVNTDGMKYLVEATKGNYESLFVEDNKNSLEQPFEDTKALSLYDGISCYYQEGDQKAKLEEIFISYCSKHTAKEFHSISECLDVNNFTKEDLPFIRKFRTLYNGYQTELGEIQSILEAVDFDYFILESTDVDYLEKLANEGNGAAMFRLGEIYEYSIGVKWNQELSEKYYKQAFDSNFILAIIQVSNDCISMHKKIIVYLIAIGVIQAYTIIFKKGNEKAFGISLSSLSKDVICMHPLLEYLYACQLIENNELFEADQMLRISADSGYIIAQEKLLDVYKGNEGFQENLKLHFLYAEKAMLQNSPKATYDLALCYMNGYGTQQSTSVGMMMMDKAAELGYSEAIRIKSLLNSL